MNCTSACTRASAGDQMIRSIELSRFKCFERLKIENVKRINVVVGDNGSGKTALMEAVFLALGTLTEPVNRYRQQRGMDASSVTGNLLDVADAFFADLFFDLDVKHPVKITLDGTSIDNRVLKIQKGLSEQAIKYFKKQHPNFIIPPESYKPFTFSWTDSRAQERFAVPQIQSDRGMQWVGTGEWLTNSFYFAATHPVNSVENAGRYSLLSKAFKEGDIKTALLKEFRVLSDISLELVGGSGYIHATVPGLSNKIPIPNISGAINRTVAILLCMLASPGSVLLIDEMENGLYYTHHKEVWKATIDIARESQSQIITSTHSLEWLRALIDAAGDDASDIALWRLDHDENGKLEFFQFDGKTLKDGVEYGVDPRGD